MEAKLLAFSLLGIFLKDFEACGGSMLLYLPHPPHVNPKSAAMLFVLQLISAAVTLSLQKELVFLTQPVLLVLVNNEVEANRA